MPTKSPSQMKKPHVHRGSAFTLIELLTVIAIIAILMALLFPAVRAVKEGGKKAQAANDVRRIATAVRSFQVEYGRYPALPPSGPPIPGIDIAVGDPCIGLKIPNRELFYTLRAMDRGINVGDAVNTRRVVYFEGQNVSDPAHPKGGFLSRTSGGESEQADCFFDPWERQYCVVIDYSYDQRIKIAYADFSGENAPALGVVAFSLGGDQSLGASGNQAFQKGTTKSDDILSWQ